MDNASLKVQCQATLALRNLASDDNYQLEIARHPRALPRLLHLLSGQGSSPAASTKIPHPQLVLAAVACIRNISIHPQNESKIIDVGFLKYLVYLLSDESEEIICHAVSTLRNLAASGGPDPELPDSTQNKSRIVESGALEKIQFLLERGASQVANASPQPSWPVMSEMTACLAVLALSPSLKAILLKSGIVRPLISLTDNKAPLEVQGNAAAAL
eukprot:Partr_v1_DN27255_c0_g1_i2_m39136 putative Vacuolar protein